MKVESRIKTLIRTAILHDSVPLIRLGFRDKLNVVLARL